MRIRIKFAKKESVQYIGHLDILRFFQRCFNRAGVRMEYSAGFNPHQRMSFAQPLGVGITSCAEYLDAEIADGQDPGEICAGLNKVCGDGFEVLNVRAVKEGARKVMAALKYAAYRVEFKHSDIPDADKETAAALWTGLLMRATETLLAKPQIPVMKRTKSGEREVDIRPQIIRLEPEAGEDSALILNMTVTAASDNNLKAETLVQALFSEAEIAYDREMVKIQRIELFAEDMIPLDRHQVLL